MFALEAAVPPASVDTQSSEEDLMLFTPQPAAVGKEAAKEPGQGNMVSRNRPTILKTGKQPGRHPWWSGRRWRKIPDSQMK